MCKLLKVPVIAVYHGRTGVDLKVRLFERFDNFILHFFNSIICVSTNTANRVKSSLSKVPIFVIQNAVDIVQINTLSTETEDQLSLLKGPNKKLIVYAGRLCAGKGLFNLIKAFIITLSKRKDIILAILGDGPDKQKISNMITSSNLSEYIHLLGFKKNIYSYYNAMEFLVLPSLSEEMPVVILEAFALHKPVVATNVGGIPEIVQHNVSGILVGPENSKELADAMDYLLSNPDITSKMGNKGFETVHAHHTFESQAIKYFSAYNKTLSDNLL